MRNIATYIFLLILFLVSCNNQDITHTDPQYRYSNINEPIRVTERELPPLFVLDSSNPQQYILNTVTNSYKIELLPDSTYIYCAYCELLNEISIGTYSNQGSSFSLSWDSTRTAEAIKDSVTYEKFDFYYKTIANKIVDVSFALEYDTLKMIKKD